MRTNSLEMEYKIRHTTQGTTMRKEMMSDDEKFVMFSALLRNLLCYTFAVLAAFSLSDNQAI